MDVSQITPWLSTAALLISIGGAVYAWFTAKSKVNEQKIVDLEKDHMELDRRVQTIEGEMRHLPAKDDVNGMKVALAEMNGKFGEQGEALKGLRRSVDRIEGYLTKAGTP